MNISLHSSGENYLKAIFLLYKKNGVVQSVQLAEYLGYSKASVSRAVSNLQKLGLLNKKEDGNLCLTKEGISTAKQIYEKNNFFFKQLIDAGVKEEIAKKEACQMEHTISYDSFKKIQTK